MTYSEKLEGYKKNSNVISPVELSREGISARSMSKSIMEHC